MKKHCEANTKLYKTWKSIKYRCLNLKGTRYKYYGGRGIKVCQAWQNDYIVFRNWALNNGYQDDLEIDRIDNNGDYTPQNCRWVTHTENIRNNSLTKLTIKQVKEIRKLYKTGDYTQKELGKIYKISQAQIGLIINNKSWKNI